LRTEFDNITNSVYIGAVKLRLWDAPESVRQTGTMDNRFDIFYVIESVE
jgi:hypothetical protein